MQWTAGRTYAPSSGFPDETPVATISTDSRTLKAGDVFFALRGEKFDGHQYLKQAAEKGAAVLVAEKDLPKQVPGILVDDALQALVGVARGLREHFKGPVIAVTGSAGKSSTKDMIAALLEPKLVTSGNPGEVLSSPASFNNLLGVAKTWCLVQDQTKRVVLEMGMNALGEIAEMCRNYRPEMGLITNIGNAHIGKLGGQEGIYRAKKELFDYVDAHRTPRAGIALNVDDPLVRRAATEAFRKDIRTVTFSAAGAKSDVRVVHRSLDPETGALRLKLEITGESFDHHFPIYGMHHSDNIAAACAAALLFGLSPREIVSRFDAISPASHRGEIVALSDQRTLIDESYNSNPKALIASLTSMASLDSTRRRVLVLGEMRELEAFSESLHAEAGQALADLCRGKSFELLLIGVGKGFEPFMQAFKKGHPGGECVSVADAAAASAVLTERGRSGDLVLVKGSRGIQLDRVVEGLIRGSSKRG